MKIVPRRSRAEKQSAFRLLCLDRARRRVRARDGMADYAALFRPTSLLRFIPFVIIPAMLLARCGPVGNANLGPDPGGGFYCATITLKGAHTLKRCSAL